MKKFLILLLLIPLQVKALTKSPIDIIGKDINTIQSYIDDGLISYETLTRLYLDRIEAYNKDYNAVITVNEDAIETAKKLDIEYKEKGRRSKIYGIPLLVKDNIDVKGLPTTNGAKGLLDSYPYENADVIEKIINAGGIILGKTNMDEFAFNAKYSHSSFGYVKNAYDINYSSYGSSGGSAVAVSANLASYALGTDTGVSTRVPAAAAGVVGLRPSFDIINSNGVIKFEATRDTVGVISKYVSDSALVLEVIDNQDKVYTNSFSTSLKGVKLAAIKGFYNIYSNSSSISTGKTDKFIKDMMEESIKKLESLGAEVIYLNDFNIPYYFDATTMCYDFNEYIKNTNSKIKSLDDLIKNGNYTQYIESYNGYYCNHDYKETSLYKDYISKRNYNINLADKKFKNLGIDAIIYPTLKTEIMTLDEAKAASNVYTPSSNIAPLVGYPAISIPMGTHGKFTYNLEILAKAENEDRIYKISSAFENINKVYNNPTIAPSLYEIPTNIDKLINYYKEYKNNDNYKIINNKADEFFKNYEDNIETIDNLIKEYENPINDIRFRRKENIKKIISITLIPLAISSIITLIIFIKKKKSV